MAVAAVALGMGTALPLVSPALAQNPDRTRPGFEIPPRVAHAHLHLAPSLRDDLAARRAVPSVVAPSGAKLGAPTVVVVVEAADPHVARRAIEQIGGTVVEQIGRLSKANVPAAALGTLADASGVDFVREPVPARAATTSEGVTESGAAAWQAASQGGAGTKVAIVDAGFQDYATKLGSELPAAVETDFGRCAAPLGERHGTAVAEIVFDMAPAATLRLVCVEDDVDYATALASMQGANVDIVNGSIGFTYTGRGDGSGLSGSPADAARLLRDQGILNVASAGNYGGHHTHGAATGGMVEGEFGTLIDLPGGDQVFGFEVAGNGVAGVFLRWDGWPTTGQDFDLYVGNDLCGLVGSSELAQGSGGVPPIEYVEFQSCSSSPQVFEVVVNRWSGTATPRLDLFFDGDVGGLELATGSDLVEPATSPAVLTVGAHCRATGAVEAYSSTGPTIDGRTKPDLSGPDAVSSSVYGPASGCDAGFRGTSASAPHVAGAAALLLGANPALEVTEIEQLLRDRALDSGTAGLDNSYGEGRLRLGAAGDTTLRAAQPMSSVAPVRLFDSRPGTLGASEAAFGPDGRTTPLPARGSLRVAVTGVAGVPVDATAVILNVTVTAPTAGGYLTVHPSTVVPRASNLNFSANQTVAQHVTATVGTDGKVQLFNGSAGTTHVIIDLSGWYGPTGVAGAATDWFTPLAAPARAMDTRPGTLGYAEAVFGVNGRTTPIPTGSFIDVQVAGLGGVPSSATAVVLNVTVTAPTTGGYLVVYPKAAPRPNASTINFRAGQTIANLAVVRVGSGGNVRVLICCGSLDVIVDAIGWYQDGVGSGYVALDPPTRDIDTRSGNGFVLGAIAGTGPLVLRVANYHGVPSDATAVMISVVAVKPTTGGYLTVYPGTSSRPPTSNLNFKAGTIVPNAVVTRLGSNGTVAFYLGVPSTGRTHLVSDLAGFFIDPADVGA